MKKQTDKIGRSRNQELISAGSKVVFFGHDHLYDHRILTAPGDSADKSIHQFVIGTAGAPLVKGNDEPGNNGTWKVEKVSHIEGKYGYTVVDVDGANVTITFKARVSAGVYQVADTYKYSVSK